METCLSPRVLSRHCYLVSCREQFLSFAKGWSVQVLLKYNCDGLLFMSEHGFDFGLLLFFILQKLINEDMQLNLCI